MPKICLLYYKNILDIAFCRFFEEYNDNFSNIDGRYVLCDSIGCRELEKKFKQYIGDVISGIVDEFSLDEPRYYFIIGSCVPEDNILLKYRDNRYFPEKLMKLIHADFKIKYFLKERDISINNVRFNETAIRIFNEMFTSRKSLKRMLGGKSRNVFFIQHRNLDCYALFKIIKNRFGRSNCINVFKEKMDGIKIPLVAVNELILKYINNKKEIIRRDEFSEISNEVSEFITSCMTSCLE